jgi:DHA1 family multidrug resistance protein-like MFS transporter
MSGSQSNSLTLERTKTIPILPKRTTGGLVWVDWYTTDDPANPQNINGIRFFPIWRKCQFKPQWSSRKRAFVAVLICFYTWVAYAGASIYTASEGEVMDRFSVNYTEAALTLSLHILAYGIGPLVFAPLCEIPAIGRNLVYYLSFIIFFALSFPIAAVDNFAGLLVLQFLQAFLIARF